eukprot:GEMP01046258.1.p1 GENE.GEMP01046258.1~~GEMP01046258.1.p1  ORF type:complete len:373 (+),score=92.34 GEMP01046258.1:159-1277(+)
MSDSSCNDSDCSSNSERDVNAPLEKVLLKDIKGRWLHSNANIGLITVIPAEGHAVLADGTVWELQEKKNTIMMDEYAIVPEKSTLSELTWANTDRHARRYKWFFEDDGDLELDFAPQQLGKRQLIPVASDDEDQIKSDADSNDDDVVVSESDPEEVGEAGEFEDPSFAVPKIVELVKDWILSTNTVAHKKRLARQGHLSKEFPIRVRGGGIRSLATKLAAYGVAPDNINHRKSGTLVILKEDARQKFIERNPQYRTHFALESCGDKEEDVTPKRRKVETAECVAEPSPLEIVEEFKGRLVNAERMDVYSILLDMEQLTINPDLLRKTKVGVDINNVAKDKALPDNVRAKAAEILQAWKAIFRAQKEAEVSVS